VWGGLSQSPKKIDSADPRDTTGKMFQKIKSMFQKEEEGKEAKRKYIIFYYIIFFFFFFNCSVL